MLTQCSHITRKLGVYCFRRRLSRPMRGDVTLSLGTRIFREAEYLAQLMASSFEEVIARPMTSDDFRSILRDYLNERLAKARSRLLAKPYGIAAFNREAKDYDTVLEADWAAAEDMIGKLKRHPRQRDGRAIEPKIRLLADAKNVPKQLHNELSLGMLQAHLQVQELILSWLRNGVTTVIDPTEPVQPSTAPLIVSSDPTPAGPKLSDLMPTFLDLMTKAGGWKSQTLVQNETTYRISRQLCGDLPLGSYKRKNLSRFFGTLRRLPTLYSKRAEWREMPPDRIVEETKGHPAKKPRTECCCQPVAFNGGDRCPLWLSEEGENGFLLGSAAGQFRG